MKIWRGIRKFLVEEKGISAVEYALLLGLIGTGIAVAAAALGTQVSTNITDATTAITP